MRRLDSILTRLFVLWLLLSSSAFAAEQGVLWQIRGKGVESYLFGTMHSEDPRVTALPEAVQRHLNDADTLMLEISLDAQTQMTVAQAMVLPQGESLSAIVGRELGRQTQQALLGFGIPAEVSERLQPWAAVVTLSMPKMESGMVLDRVLYERAVQAGKEFVPLESPQEQLSVFTSLSNREQKMLLRDVLESYQSYPAMFERLTGAYLRGDLAAMVKMGEENPMSGDPALQQKMMSRLLDERNLRMVERLEPQMRQTKVFVGVGALHLTGEQGLIALLRRRGYELTPLY